MFCRCRFQLLLLILVGAVVDGGTLGFRAAWASCGDWLADPAMALHTRPSAPLDQLSSELNLHFEQLHLREDERADGTADPDSPRRRLCGCTDPSCSMQPALPTTPLPVPVNWDMDRHAYWPQFDSGPENKGCAHDVGSLVLIPLRRPTDIFRPPKVLS